MSGFSLYTNKRIKKEKSTRWLKFFIDFDFSKKNHTKLRKYISSWAPPLLFNKANRKLVPNQPGIYLFFVKPDKQLFNEQSYILYIGYSMNLWKRYGDYINKYKPSEEPNYFHRRLMLNAWEDSLYYTFLELKNHTQAEVMEIEDMLIDSMVPPINRDFTHAFIKEQVRINRMQ
ncbi:hypothetical protein [Pontibacter cellulosilyticus]|uniref:GIY-YIG domain-containing protein n=1 Tax=Pontibacter cellulosilyticus TaxID=1720253 RepID=A0A923SHC9_9BACT|nr:hypothetical protein [Pontibacter cellulosilyticus]MBC5991417.1 hypothetical protein [Pontibacter cellulosilyticus]